MPLAGPLRTLRRYATSLLVVHGSVRDLVCTQYTYEHNECALETAALSDPLACLGVPLLPRLCCYANEARRPASSPSAPCALSHPPPYRPLA